MIHGSPAVSALSAYSTGVHGSAYTIANISTDGFQPVDVRYQSGTNDRGVEPAITRQNTQDVVSISPEARAAAGLGPSNTEISREIPSMMQDQRSFEANAAVIRTQDEMLGTKLDLKI